MKAAKIVSGLLAIFVGMPIWYFLLYTLLKAAHVDRLVWFLFWVYLPVGLLVRIIDDVIVKAAEQK